MIPVELRVIYYIMLIPEVTYNEGAFSASFPRWGWKDNDALDCYSEMHLGKCYSQEEKIALLLQKLQQ